MVSGAVFGLGRGLSEGQNVLKTIYKDYNQGIELGDINFTKRGVGETLRWNPKQAQNFPELVNDIKNATRLPDAPNLKTDLKPNVSHYELYQGKNGIHHVEVAKDGYKRYYITKDTPNEGIRATSTGRDGSIPGATFAYPIQTRVQGVEPNIIINDFGNNINPAQVSIPETNSSIKPFELHAEKFDWRTMPLADPLKKDEGHPTGFGAPVTGQVFTPDHIGRMSREEFAQNELAIMSQMKDGLIQNQTPANDFSGFTNPATGSKQIFSREDIGAMSTDDFTRNEKAINAQLNSIGVPTSGELHSATSSSGVVYVEPYMRSDGVQVKGYYRSR